MGAAIAAVIFMGKKSGGRVFHRERAANVHPKLRMFLDWWGVHGAFPITVTAGGRTQEAQTALFNQGRGTAGAIITNASSVTTTAHGPRLLNGSEVFCAIDVAPVTLDAAGATVASVDYADWSKFQALGKAGLDFGLVWGGTFATLKDGPHLEVAGWKSLPLPGSGVA